MMDDDKLKSLLNSVIVRDRQILDEYDKADSVSDSEIFFNYLDFVALISMATDTSRIRVIWWYLKKRRLAKKMARERGLL